MTKQTVDETTLKCHVAVEGADKISETITKMLSNNTLAIYDATVFPERTAPIKTQIKLETDRIGKIKRELYNLEESLNSEKSPKIDLDLDLYQMEKV